MSLWGSFTGSDARRQLERSKAQADNALAQGKTDALGAYNTSNTAAQGALTSGYNSAQGYLQPYAAGGQRAQDMYWNALGVNGAGAQKSFMSNYSSGDPFRAWNDDNTAKMIARQSAARGWGGGAGMTQLALARAGMERGSQDYESYMNRLGQQAGQGAQFSGQQSSLASGYGQGMAGLNSQYGNNVANLYYGNAQQQAGNAINFGNAMAQNSNVFANNMLGLGSVVASAMTGVPMGRPGGSTTPGTAANGGWTTTTTPGGSNFLGNLGSFFGR